MSLRCVPTKFQKGDLVATPKGNGRVSVVGRLLNQMVYRVGRDYWHEWQLKRRPA